MARGKHDERPVVLRPDAIDGIPTDELADHIDGRLTYEEKAIVRQSRQDYLEQEAYKAKTQAANQQLEQLHESTAYHFAETAMGIDQYREKPQPGDKLQMDLNDFADDQVAIAKQQFKANVRKGGENVLNTAHRSVKPEPRKKSKLEEFFGE